MSEGGVIIVDAGKTVSKAILLDSRGALVARRQRANLTAHHDGLAVLDVAGIEGWLGETLTEFSMLARVRTIVPVGHGAGAAILREGRLVRPPLDYEQPLPPAIRADYDRQRDAYALTGSPALPNGLNLGAQIHFLECRNPDLLKAGATIVPWAQYWSWLLSGVAASEVSSLGCHTDLWCPFEGVPSPLAIRRGWAERLAPLRPAGDALGTLRPEWARRTGLAADVQVLCGVHDSNAALLAARGFAEIGGGEATVLSTGTWFVAMRSPAADVAVDPALLDEDRDCLVNVDVAGRPIPSSRFMGGRELQLLLAEDGLQIDDPGLQDALLREVPGVIESGAMVLPTLLPGVGPFPRGRSRWRHRPDSPIARAAAVAIYAALVADTALDLIGARDRLLIEGRFARAEAFVGLLASLRPSTKVYVAEREMDLAFGAARLVDGELAPPASLHVVPALADEMDGYRARWLQLTGGEVSP